MIIYELPLPPSVNAMFANRSVGKQRARGRIRTEAYRKWREQAGLHILCQGPLRKMAGSVNLRITISDGASGDIDNRCKAVLDFLVHHGIIEGDHKKIVRKILLEWGDVEGARVEITEAARVSA